MIEKSTVYADAKPADELVTALRRALMELDEKYRTPVALCCEQGFSKREAAAILEMPESTVSKYVGVGLERLRESLKRAGYAAAPAALVGGLAHTAPPVPAGLSAALEKLLAGEAAVNGAGTGAAVAGAALKGGLIVKIGLGIAAAGLVAGGVFWAVGGKTEEPAKPKVPSAVEGPPAKVEQPRKFATPVTDPSAEWENMGLWAGRGPMNPSLRLDGPVKEAMFCALTASAAFGPPRIFADDGGEWVFRTYDKRTERFLTLVGSGVDGDFNGPFSRARVGGWGGYNYYPGSGNDKYYYMKGSKTKALRRFNFAKRVIEPFAPEVDCSSSHIAAYDGGVVLLDWRTKTFTNVSDEGKVLSKCPADFSTFKQPITAISYDPKRNRVIGANRSQGEDGGWMLWYWDLAAGGKFVGLIGGTNTPPRKTGATGPFKGSLFWCPLGYPLWGADDPDFRFIYICGGDEGTTYRMDLEKQYWVKFGPSDPQKATLESNGAANTKGMRYHFGDYPEMLHNGCRCALTFDDDGDVYGGYRNIVYRWKRVK